MIRRKEKVKQNKKISNLKTRPTQKSVAKFIESVSPDWKREDTKVLLRLFEEVTTYKGVMWGDSIIGFGSYTYKNTMGEYSWLITGFSPRQQSLTIYIMQGFDRFSQEIDELNLDGKVKHSKSCLYIKRLADIDLSKLKKFLLKVINDMKERYDCSPS